MNKLLQFALLSACLLVLTTVNAEEKLENDLTLVDSPIILHREIRSPGKNDKEAKKDKKKKNLKKNKSKKRNMKKNKNKKKAKKSNKKRRGRQQKGLKNNKKGKKKANEGEKGKGLKKKSRKNRNNKKGLKGKKNRAKRRKNKNKKKDEKNIKKNEKKGEKNIKKNEKKERRNMKKNKVNKKKGRKNMKKNKKKARKNRKSKKARKNRKNKKARKSRKNKNKKKKGKKNKKRKNSKKNRSNGRQEEEEEEEEEEEQSEEDAACDQQKDCLAAATKYMKQLRDKVRTLRRQSARIDKFVTVTEKKNAKRTEFENITDFVLMTGGGDPSMLKCADSSLDANLTQVHTDLMGCADSIQEKCETEEPEEIDFDLISECIGKMDTFESEITTCINEEDANKCECWSSDTLKELSTQVGDCDIGDMAKKVTTFKKSCTAAFAACRKLQDAAGPLLFDCKNP